LIFERPLQQCSWLCYCLLILLLKFTYLLEALIRAVGQALEPASALTTAMLYRNLAGVTVTHEELEAKQHIINYTEMLMRNLMSLASRTE